MRKKAIEIIMVALMFISIGSSVGYVLPKKAASNTVNNTVKETIVIDAGHGGIDPGKVGINNALEKDINLKIALMLKDILTEKGYNVVLTRDGDYGLYGENDSNKKNVDMKKRCEIISKANPSLVVSIHQNSFSDEKVKGAQVFYYKHSDKGEKLAATIQKSLCENINNGNTRTHKSNDNYYLLLNTKCPTVIVECGFLSNWEEATLLLTDEYGQQIANAVGMGIIQFLQEAE